MPVRVTKYRPSEVSAKLVIRPAHPTAVRLGRLAGPPAGWIRPIIRSPAMASSIMFR